MKALGFAALVSMLPFMAQGASAADFFSRYSEQTYTARSYIQPNCVEFPHISELHCVPGIIVAPSQMTHDDVTALTTLGHSRKPYFELSSRRIY